MLLTKGQSLRTKCALWAFLTTGLLTSTFLAAYACLSYSVALNRYEREMGNRMEIAAASLDTMIDRTDYLGMTRQANSILITKGVSGVTIYDLNNRPLIHKGSSQGFVLQQPILHDREQVGMIEVTFSNAPIKEETKALALVGAVIALISVPFTAILTWVVSGHQLQDIRELADKVKQIGDPGTTCLKLPGMERKDEIGSLARALVERDDALRESKQQERLLFHAVDQSYDSVVITDAEGSIEYVNPAFTRITGYTKQESLGQNPRILRSGRHPVSFYTRMWNQLTSGKSWQGTIINKRKNGELFHEEATISPVMDHNGIIHHYVSMKRDVTQETMLKQKLARAEKMQAIGLMAGGVAHDLNNILAGVVGYPELLLMSLPEDSDIRKPIESVLESGKKAVTVVADLLTVARGVAATKRVVSLHSLIVEYLNSPEFLKLAELYPKVSVCENLEAKQTSIRCSAIHIQKCLMNLVMNAAESIEGEGTVTITTSDVATRDHNKDTENFPKGEYIQLTIQDSGTGITAEDLEHIFEPFYTKKVMGRSGTGLGLAVVWNSVLDHHGTLNVESSTNGTSFHLFFPITSDHETAETSTPVKSSIKGGNEYILVVDDEPHVRDIACTMLKKLGYQVDSVNSGEQAIAFVKQQAVDLLIIDMLMEPGIDGKETYREISNLYPGQKALITSGFSLSKDVKKTLKRGAGKFIYKPYTLEELGEAVREVLT